MIRSYFRDLCKLYNWQNFALHNKRINHRFAMKSLKDGYSSSQSSIFLIFEQLYFLPSTPSPPVNLISGPPLKILNILIMSEGLFLKKVTPFPNVHSPAPPPTAILILREKLRIIIWTSRKLGLVGTGWGGENDFSRKFTPLKLLAAKFLLCYKLWTLTVLDWCNAIVIVNPFD